MITRLAIWVRWQLFNFKNLKNVSYKSTSLCCKSFTWLFSLAHPSEYIGKLNEIPSASLNRCMWIECPCQSISVYPLNRVNFPIHHSSLTNYKTIFKKYGALFCNSHTHFFSLTYKTATCLRDAEKFWDFAPDLWQNI